ncbi:HNH endonuclease domain-containing protein [Chryseobacterium sp. JJR-5R]|uniref:type II CRISPR RNA-guided endonuclease Cas9 n=1 Tax=Chryseobacterium sp. JJR-5R TaxID=3093923 RepID=UPI002A75F804|nr:type II CRISPR RNA-guided endonuclease Cas9 [Chryseobacterium sp. JJR-5R]WPO84325.1 HNH endonuclease domain-containing protein [Chryseobacterium sp. JJR-5R]
MKTILGLDLGTNSIGWALVEIDQDSKTLRIIALGSRIIPMDGQEFSKFNAGQKIESAAGNRTTLRRARITKERYLLRRDRLHLVLNLLEALPGHYKIEIDFEKDGKKCGQFKDGKEPKIAYLPTRNLENRYDFYFEEAFNEMIKDLQKVNPEIKNEKKKRVPKDWTIYFLRNKAMSERISLEELAWVLLSYNQKRGTDLDEIENEDEKSDEIKEQLDLKVIKVEQNNDVNGDFFEIILNDAENFKYKEYTTEQLTFKDDVKEVTKILKLDDAGNIINEKTTYHISDLYNLTLANIKHTDIDDKKAKHKYDFIYTNGWKTEKKKEKFDVTYQKLEKQIKEESKVITELFVISNKYDFTGKPESIVPNIKLPDFNSEGSKDWTLLKKKTEKDVISYNIANGFLNKDGSAKHFISPKIYDVLKNDAKTGERTRIIGGLFQTIDRKFYREELYQIINTQRKFHTSTLDNKDTFEKCVKLLYPHNEEHSKALMENKQALTNLLVEDILLYQRPLKSKRSEVSDCKYEIDYWKEDVNISTGEIIEIPVYKKAVSASHPLFQEFRIWDKIHNIRLIQLESEDAQGNSKTNVDITSQYFKPENYQALFNHFNSRSTVGIDDFLTFCKEQFKLDIGKRGERKILWNYPVEEEFKGNETRKNFEIRFKRCGFEDFNRFMTQQKEIELWHYLYSVTFAERKKVSQVKDDSNPKFGKTGICNFFNKYFKNENIAPEVLEKLCRDFENYPKFASKYASYSIKALNKILSVMRVGENFLTSRAMSEKWQEKYIDRADTILKKNKEIDWSAEDIDLRNVVLNDVNMRTGEIPFPKGLFNTFKNFESVDNFQFLNLTQASYFVYGRHSELAQAKYWNSPDKIREEITKELKHHSLNNPTAEKVLKETLKVVADIWEIHGNSEEKFFNEIHLEVARELQKSNQEKKDIVERQKNSRAENNRLRNILEEFLSSSSYKAKRGNQDHFERLKIVEDGAKIRSYLEKDFYLNNKDKFSKTDIETILKKTKITKTDFEKYKLWIEQGYKSPYTGNLINLTDLFDGNKYNIDHIFSRAAITNDSLNNKVVCEAVINRFKSHRTGREFIAQFGGKAHTVFDEKLNKNVMFNLIDEDAYVSLVKSQFKDSKKLILLSKDVPKGFTESQLNNTKYIARKAMELLSHIVREDGEVEFRSRNVLPVSGAVTDRLKKEWKINQIWTELLKPRFERLNKIHNSQDFGNYSISKSGHQYFDINIKNILEKNDKFDLKRLDHRHHALDALIIALCTENHVQYFNNINSGITNKKKEKMEAIKKQRAGIKRQIMYSEKDKENPNEKVWRYMLPGSFRKKEALNNEKDSVVDILWTNNYSANESKDYKNIILESLENCIASFKNDFKIVSKSSNKYESYYDEKGDLRLNKAGKPQKELISQNNKNNKHWSVRKPLHKDNPSSRIETGILAKVWYSSMDSLEDIVDEGLRNKAISIFQNIDENEDVLTFQKTKYKEAKELLKMIEKKEQQLKKEKQLSSREDIIKSIEKLKSDYENEYFPFLIFENEKLVEKLNFNEIKYRKYQPLMDLAERKSQAKKIVTLDAMKKKLEKISDAEIKNELLDHLEQSDNDIDIAFSVEGIENFNNKRKEAGKNILKKIPISESGSGKYTVGNKFSNRHKWVEAEQGTNLYFAIYEDKNKIRNFEKIPLRTAINRVINHEEIVPKFNKKGCELLFVLSPNDLIYLPTMEEFTSPNPMPISNLNKYRFFTVNDFSKTIYFSPVNISNSIISKEIDMNYDNKKDKITGSFDTKTASFDGVQIKDFCWKVETNRLGEIIEIINQ